MIFEMAYFPHQAICHKYFNELRVIRCVVVAMNLGDVIYVTIAEPSTGTRHIPPDGLIISWRNFISKMGI